MPAEARSPTTAWMTAAGMRGATEGSDRVAVATSATPRTRSRTTSGWLVTIAWMRHAAHRVPGQDEVVALHRGQHCEEVLSEPIHVHRPRPERRPGVAALVVEHHPVAGGDQPAGHGRPDLLRARPAVRQHDGRPLRGAGLEHDELGAVVGGDRPLGAGGEGEPLRTARVVPVGPAAASTGSGGPRRPPARRARRRWPPARAADPVACLLAVPLVDLLLHSVETSCPHPVPATPRGRIRRPAADAVAGPPAVRCGRLSRRAAHGAAFGRTGEDRVGGRGSGRRGRIVGGGVRAACRPGRPGSRSSTSWWRSGSPPRSSCPADRCRRPRPSASRPPTR